MTANFSFFLLAVFTGAIYWGWHWPYIAKLMPLYVVAIPGVILCGLQIYREATDWESRQEKKSAAMDMDETHGVTLDRRTETQRTIMFFTWFSLGALGIWLLGIVITLPLLVFLYMLVEGKEKLTTAVIMTACVYGLVWGLFEYVLGMRWPAGLLFS